MYDYSAQDEDEVSFRDGDYIVNVQPIDDGWMYGTVQRTGKTGVRWAALSHGLSAVTIDLSSSFSWSVVIITFKISFY